MRRLVAVTLLMFPVIGGCRHAQLVQPDRLKAGDDIREAVFRYEFTHNCWYKPEKVYFLALGNDKDPSPALLKRFADNKPPVKPVSKCKISSKLVQRPKTAVIDKETGDRGLIFRVESIKWVTPKQVQVEGGYYADGLGASGNTYIVEFRGNRWVVVKDTMNWIS
jgi:hypothetical protein